jgi:PAS domain S-box-containing protein
MSWLTTAFLTALTSPAYADSCGGAGHLFGRCRSTAPRRLRSASCFAAGGWPPAGRCAPFFASARRPAVVEVPRGRDPSSEQAFSGGRREGVAPKARDDELEAARLRLMIDTIRSLVHTAWPDGNQDFFHRSWLDYVGVPLEELLGWGWTKYVHPEDVDGLVAAWRASLTTGNPLEHEARVRRANGDYRWMLHRKVAVKDSSGCVVRWFGLSVDVEPLKQAEERARASARASPRDRLGARQSLDGRPGRRGRILQSPLARLHGVVPC